MLENETPQDAMTESSPVEDNQTQTTPESQESGSSPAEQAQVPSSQQQDAKQGADAGLPPKENLYGEFRRKIFEEIAPVIQGAVRESMLGFQGQVAGQQAQGKSDEVKYQGKYTTADLEAILRHPDANEYDKHFANRGLAYIEARQDTMKDMRATQETQANQSRQSQALQSIVQDYPQVFNKSSNSWNFADPLWQRSMQIYNSEPRLQGYGNEGLRVAMDRAYAQMAREGQLTIKKKEVKLNSQQKAIDKNQSQAMSSGTLSPGKQDNGAMSSKAKIMEAWKKDPENEALKKAALSSLIPKSWLT